MQFSFMDINGNLNVRQNNKQNSCELSNNWNKFNFENVMLDVLSGQY